LIEKYPAVRDQMKAAVLVAERRWNVLLNNGIDIRLPEEGADQALATLVKLDHDDKLLTRDIAVVDLRLPDRVSVRLSDDAAAARLDALNKEKKARKKGGAA
jgi:cell division protein FtsQ